MELNDKKEEMLDATDATSQPESGAPAENAGATPVKRPPRVLRKNKTQYMVTLATLAALVIIMQLISAIIPPIGGITSISLVLIPIVIGGLALGIKAGAVLGFVFGLFVFLWGGVFAGDTFTANLFLLRPVATALICLVKGVAAGVVPPLAHHAIYRFLPRVSKYIVAALAPICNTGAFLVGVLIVFQDLTAVLTGLNLSVVFFLGTIVLGNFALELVLNVLFAPTIYRIVQIVSEKKK